MEPGHEDREYIAVESPTPWKEVPQWSPVMKTGNTYRWVDDHRKDQEASMEPGHEDREYMRSVP